MFAARRPGSVQGLVVQCYQVNARSENAGLQASNGTASTVLSGHSLLRLALAWFGRRAVRTWPAKRLPLQKDVAPALPSEIRPTLLESALGRQTTNRHARMAAPLLSRQVFFSLAIRDSVLPFIHSESKFAYSENDATSIRMYWGNGIGPIQQMHILRSNISRGDCSG